jgi:hypothetical protein
MREVLVATAAGVQVLGERTGQELDGHVIHLVARGLSGTALAVVSGRTLYRRTRGQWELLAEASLPLASVLDEGVSVLGGGMSEPALLRLDSTETRLAGLEQTPGRERWYQQGPPLCIRALTRTADGAALLAAVHVGGIPRSTDGGKSWQPTLDIDADVHDVQAHPEQPSHVAAASAFGLQLSSDGGATWTLVTAPAPICDALAVGWLEGSVLYSLQDGPFATRSQLWRMSLLEPNPPEPVGGGLPEWFEGKIDTGCLSTCGTAAAVLDGGGNLWVSADGQSWERRARALAESYGVAVLR